MLVVQDSLMVWYSYRCELRRELFAYRELELGAAALPTLEKFAKISRKRAENGRKVVQNFRKQWILCLAAP